MAFQHGKNITLSIDDSGGTPQVFTTLITDVTFSQSRDTAESTTIGATGDAKTYVPGYLDATLGTSGPYDAVSDGYLYGLFSTDNTATFSYSPDNGTTTFSGEALITSYSVNGGAGGLVNIDASLQVTGVVTRT